jgi:hypothetical protein
MPKMTLYEFAEEINQDLQIVYCCGMISSKKFLAEFKNSIIKGHKARGRQPDVGFGETPEDALANYTSIIKGKTLIFNPDHSSTYEVQVPDILTF